MFKMNQKNDKWMLVGLVIAFIGVVYFFSSYGNIFERRLSYLYDTESDDVYTIELAPSLSKDRKWDTFNPFKPFHYTKPDYVEYIGKLHSRIALYKSDINLRNNNPDEWIKKQKRELKTFLSNNSGKVNEIEYWDVLLIPNSVQDAKSRILDPLANIISPKELKSKNIVVVDAVISHTTLTFNQNFGSKPTNLRTINSFRTIKNALWIKGAAAYELYSQGLGPDGF